MRRDRFAVARLSIVAIGAAGIAMAVFSATGAPSATHSELHARYADARLRLAVSRLDEAERLNRHTPGLVTDTDLRRLRNRVEVLRSQVHEVHAQPHGYALAEQRATANAIVRICQEDLDAAHDVNLRRPGTVSPEKLRQLEIKGEIAKLRVQLLEDPSFLDSPLDVMQMQIDQIADLLFDALDRMESTAAVDRR